MRQLFFALLLASLLVACRQSEDKRAQPLMQEIERLYEEGNYQTALDSIRKLRTDFPGAVESRRKALGLWQEASLKLAQQDIARTDSALQAVTVLYNQAKTLRERNFIGIKKDSLQIRYDALCGTVRVIHRRQQETAEKKIKK
ncbi:hypothetical protein C7120_00260 [Prevotella sp. oral taxon 376]|uniref:hypothetical protein n=1 Tax=Prevotella sp. oral taxon 376 TaxID=712466 RepID=UPI000D1E3BC5|nr:hypothetical protein [Prevotella sp. oral taxon 376]PTL33106.1 hypothetical protein C7120_00260 [Prevotella sp. oral taxon 376]